MPKAGVSIHIPLAEKEAVALLGRVKPTAEMPRQGANRYKAPKKKSAEPPTADSPKSAS